MNIIKSEELVFEDGKVILKTTCAGDIGYINELQYIKMQLIIDRMINN